MSVVDKRIRAFVNNLFGSAKPLLICMNEEFLFVRFQDLEIHGVMRFYFQESKDKVLTKCIRVSSTATARAVISALVDKFHPDLKM